MVKFALAVKQKGKDAKEPEESDAEEADSDDEADDDDSDDDDGQDVMTRTSDLESDNEEADLPKVETKTTKSILKKRPFVAPVETEESLKVSFWDLNNSHLFDISILIIGSLFQEKKEMMEAAREELPYTFPGLS